MRQIERRTPCTPARFAGMYLLCVTFPAFVLAARIAGGQTIEEAHTVPEWETAFRTADARWRGADAAYSVELGAGRVLWLFGDTWITDADAVGRAGGRLVRNTLAIQQVEQGKTLKTEFYWRADERSEAPGGAAPVFAPEPNLPGWLWPLSGVAHGWKLYLFLSRVVESSAGLGFAGAGNALVVVENPEARPSEWWMRQYEIPFFRHTAQGDRVFGLSNVIAEDSLFVYGIHEDWRKGFGGRDVIVARTPLDALGRGNFGAWKFWSARGWASDVDAAVGLFDEAAAEMSVHYDTVSQRYIAVYTRFGLSGDVVLREAPLPEGPWSDARLVYECPEAGSRMTYAAKAHPELHVERGRLLITYATNSTEFADNQRDMELYWPRFVSVALPDTASEDVNSHATEPR